MGHLIRDYRESDLASLQSIRAAAFAPVFAEFRSAAGPQLAAVAFADAEREQEQLLHTLCSDTVHHVLVAEDGTTPVGFLALRCDAAAGMGEIVLMAVDPKAQRQGLGRNLVARALSEMRGKGMRAATVGTGGDGAHGAARALYGDAGFTVAIPSVHFYCAL